MFTGLIEATGKVINIDTKPAGARMTVQSEQLDFSDVNRGDSIAVNGVCLTVVDLAEKQFSVDISNETLQRSSLKHYEQQSNQQQRVNLEKAMLPTTRLGGHLVSGHVDGVAEICRIEQSGNAWQFYLKAPLCLHHYIAEKGSVCIDGISLTVNEWVGDLFRLTIIPHTMTQTIMSDYQVGTEVNLEVDLIARYLEQLMSNQTDRVQTGTTVDRAFLEQAGFKTS